MAESQKAWHGVAFHLAMPLANQCQKHALFSIFLSYAVTRRRQSVSKRQVKRPSYIKYISSFLSETSRKPRGNLAETWRKPGGNLAETSREPCGNLAETSRKPRGNLAETLRKPRGNLAETSRKLRGNLAETSRKPRGNLAETCRFIDL